MEREGRRRRRRLLPWTGCQKGNASKNEYTLFIHTCALPVQGIDPTAFYPPRGRRRLRQKIATFPAENCRLFSSSLLLLMTY